MISANTFLFRVLTCFFVYFKYLATIISSQNPWETGIIDDLEDICRKPFPQELRDLFLELGPALLGALCETENTFHYFLNISIVISPNSVMLVEIGKYVKCWLYINYFLSVSVRRAKKAMTAQVNLSMILIDGSAVFLHSP